MAWILWRSSETTEACLRTQIFCGVRNFYRLVSIMEVHFPRVPLMEQFWGSGLYQ